MVASPSCCPHRGHSRRKRARSSIAPSRRLRREARSPMFWCPRGPERPGLFAIVLVRQAPAGSSVELQPVHRDEEGELPLQAIEGRGIGPTETKKLLGADAQESCLRWGCAGCEGVAGGGYSAEPPTFFFFGGGGFFFGLAGAIEGDTDHHSRSAPRHRRNCWCSRPNGMDFTGRS